MKILAYNPLVEFRAKDFNILIIEDSSSMIKIIDTIFKDKGFNTFLSTTLKDAREKINSIKIDYVILDINLPDGNGYELIKELSSSLVKIIVLTSQTDSQLREISYQKGIIDFINKDKNFIYKIFEIPNLIKQLEKNRTKTILIIDDSFVVKEQLKDIFENRNYSVLIASNTTEALNLINTNKIHLMLLDLELEKENGFDFLLKNRKVILDELKIKVMIITGNISSTILRDAFRLGVRDIIKKPYVIEELILKTDMFINDKDNENESEAKTQLLKQYKNAVDRSFIVSKTDDNGIITYINEAFCKISGYKEEELLGKSHNIVRHKDMPSSTFKDMWKTIKELKKPWMGTIKNRKKDGSDYWVQTIINPILDENNNVIEYIGIRTDITEIEKAKQQLKEQYNISQNNFQEIMNLSKLYENAMDESNIILRVNQLGNITYVNEKFYTISGYTQEELIGKPYDNIERVFPPSQDDNKISKHLKSGKIWNGQIHNIFKDGKIHYFLATVVPIINLQGETLEYMSIRKEITEVVELHKEIEETQREVIYKMGEIGESRSNETGNHVKRVAEYSKLLAKLYGLSEKECEILFTASPMHDIGKVGIPDSILNKPGKLTPEEWEIMRKHSMVGYNILKNSKREILKAAAIVARDHHEKWDGNGYPRKTKAEETHIYGRITAVADVFDALGSSRCYKKAWKDEDIFKLLEEEKGKQFEPKLIDLFFKNIDKFKEIRDKYKD
ncbi:response regulator receiver protein [Arcobacter suis]|uniref:Multi-sensor domain-containing response regulator c-di-GMP phosphodiesterase, RpfG family n=1 Tax=Arcobacter suis CECT 7833 TaxID=663365 RepID=A0AAD0SST9_9BACT|nr:PAS domain S-box protein [Arcobacter suis]AXX90410.1 multi-sensor domain-containing response regulator c-di-GMP phosphodiesterase, RpfG family [Arcobacter suis CECT 7833]RWS45598.1 response regulator receiver protein [Arcobacter suis]